MAKSVPHKTKKKKPEVENVVEAEPVLEALQEPIVIDESKKWIFESERSVYEHFNHEITVLEHEYENLKRDTDINEESVEDFETYLAAMFEDPDEIWKDEDRFENLPVYTYVRKFEEEGFSYVALTYVDKQLPTFIFLHFPTQDETLIEAYRRTQKVYQRGQTGSADADALSEGDELAVGLYKAMQTVRADTDIPEEKFQEYLQYRDETVEEADEIWRSTDLQGNVLVTFIKEYQLETEDFTYITVTMEDNFSETHYVLFSFPSKDKSLVDRYRHGETLHTEDVIQEESH